MAGYAGTGKTTLATEIARSKGNVVFGAFTGKAAAVMRKKGCTNATTIDQLIYQPRLQAWCANDPPCRKPPCGDRCRYHREKFVGRSLNPESNVAKADLVIIDEVSMVGEQRGTELLSFGTKLLVLGDDVQLPPIGDGGFFTKNKPDFQLTEVHRQALGSPVIDLATRARKHLRLECGRYGDSAVVEGIFNDDLLNHDVVICGTHKMRHRINRQIRRVRGFRGTLPEVGERVICLKNNHFEGLRNGTIWTVTKSAPPKDGFVAMIVADDEGAEVKVIAPEAGFTSYDGNGGDMPAQPFAFAALTLLDARRNLSHNNFDLLLEHVRQNGVGAELVDRLIGVAEGLENKRTRPPGDL